MRIFLLALFVAAANAVNLAPILKARDAVPNSYLVKLKDGVNANAFAKSLSKSIPVKRIYDNVFGGVAIDAQQAQLAQLQAMDLVEYIEEDSVMRAACEWGVDRVNQRATSGDGNCNVYGTGAGAHVYIADTGLYYCHQEFGGRAVFFWDFDSTGDGSDCHGHGTHCGGTAGGATTGIATSATIQAVRVLNCQGAGLTNNIVAGLDAIAASGPRPGVCSMSLGGGVSPGLDQGVRDLIAAGVPTAVAAGNDNADACNTSPARVAEADTVGSTTATDARSSFSNYGTCVDLFAPGSNIRSSYNTGCSAYSTMSGTSMACPHVAGALTVHMASGRCTDGASCKTLLANEATAGAISNPGAGSPNLLLYIDP